MARARKNAKSKEMDGDAPAPKSRRKRGSNAAAASSAANAPGNASNLPQFNNSCDMLPPYHHPQDNMYPNHPYTDYTAHQSSMMHRPMSGSPMMNQGSMQMPNNRYPHPGNKSNENHFSTMDGRRVFNPNNPSAPTVYLCGICQKEVQDNHQAIMCESGCSFWYHRTCTGMTENAFTLLNNEVYAEWVCELCFDKGVSFIKCKP